MALSTTSRLDSVELISEDAKFNDDVESLINRIKPQGDGTLYGIVAIIGRQGTGKSTLMNGLFNCDFQVRNANVRTIGSRTTKGVWLAYDFKNTIVMDIEGADGIARGQNTLFEKQTALLAIAVADVVIINMMLHDVDTVNGGLQPLLTTIFEAYEKLQRPHKKNLMFVIRDYHGVQDFNENLIKSTNEIWDSIPKSNNHAPFSNYFKIEVATLPNFLYLEEQWKKEVMELRKRLCNLHAFRRPKDFCVSDFGVHLQQMWQGILENKDIDIPSERNLTISFRCDEIAKEIYSDFCKKVDEVGKNAKSLGQDDFKRRLEELKKEHSSRYDTKTTCYDESIREVKGNELKEKLKVLVDKMVSEEKVRAAEEARAAAEAKTWVAEEKASEAEEKARLAEEKARVAEEKAQAAEKIARSAAEEKIRAVEEKLCAAEKARAAEEYARAAAQKARAIAEEKALVASNEKAQAVEQAWIAAERAREASQEATWEAEKARAAEEKARLAEEKARIAAEEKAQAAELARVAAEKARAFAEERARAMEKDGKKLGKAVKKTFSLLGQKIFG